jgi:hypothetical protein
MSIEVRMPSLPAEISADGSEIWDWAARLSKATQLAHDIRETQAKIRKLSTTCGDCDNWMKSSECPAEKNVNGRNHGPSCNAPKCSQFKESFDVLKQRLILSKRMQELEIAARETK